MAEGAWHVHAEPHVAIKNEAIPCKPTRSDFQDVLSREKENAKDYP